MKSPKSHCLVLMTKYDKIYVQNNGYDGLVLGYYN